MSCLNALYEIREDLLFLGALMSMTCVWYCNSSSLRWTLQCHAQSVDRSGPVSGRWIFFLTLISIFPSGGWISVSIYLAIFINCLLYESTISIVISRKPDFKHQFNCNFSLDTLQDSKVLRFSKAMCSWLGFLGHRVIGSRVISKWVILLLDLSY